MEFAGKLTTMPALSIRVMEESSYTAMRGNLTDVLHKEAVNQSEDVKEGIKAIRGKK